jgi:para-nitrobenzyl esterase
VIANSPGCSLAGAGLQMAIVFWLCGSAVQASVNLQAGPPCGGLQGVALDGGVRLFAGIPFAAPPVGDNRWRPPQPLAPWRGVRKADHFGDRPMQLHLFNDMRFRSTAMSEDCLYLNVWTPQESAEADVRLPVLVYFYGGGYVAGDSSEYRYDGAAMARRGIVVVTANYRLGVFGFLAHPELTAESPHHASGNYGLMDQSAALRWVRANIAAFGGDPMRVTIAGQSAGAFSVCAQMASPLSKDLIAGAIGQSGGLPRADNMVPLASAERVGIAFAASVGARSLAELRRIPAERLLHPQRQGQPSPGGFPMAVDGYFFPQAPADIFAAGQQAHVPLLLGWTNQEMNFRTLIGTGPVTLDRYRAAVEQLYGDHADQVLALYPATDDAQARDAASALGSDRFINYPTWHWAELARRTGGQPVYRYLFDHPRPPIRPDQLTSALTPAPDAPRDINHDPHGTPTGAVHASDIEYALGNLATNPRYAWTPDDQRVSNNTQEYFANFIKTGNPNGDGLPAWPPAGSGAAGAVMHLDVEPHVEPEMHRDRYQMLDTAPSTSHAQ